MGAGGLAMVIFGVEIPARLRVGVIGGGVDGTRIFKGAGVEPRAEGPFRAGKIALR